MDRSDDALERKFHDLMTAAHPISAMAAADALRAVRAYPQVLMVGPVFGVAEQARHGWEVSSTAEATPQAARDVLAERLRKHAEVAVDAATRGEFLAVAGRLDRERRDDLTVAGLRFRIVRVEQVVRMNAEAPEPPRPTDPDPRPSGRGIAAGRVREFLPTADDGSMASTAELGRQFDEAVSRRGVLPAPVREDACRAMTAYPRVRIMAPVFSVAEQVDDGWRSATMPCDTPQRARDTLAAYFSGIVPAIEQPDVTEREEYAAAARRLELERADDLTVAGRRFRIVRVEKVARLGPDGPEPPRPSDFDPEPPIGA
ncbi:DUF5954 family protein [Actinomadura alba]|uniref:PE-PGRS family protein n=1 Tax=Actinomadura alba TaxID=406431 RepID=A0ABR7LLN9_9ACTN|nr:DUF5954 family protein [Actinomadura alba]MBC6465415.1 PE-PGRS family protein [Actinomadura alba]